MALEKKDREPAPLALLAWEERVVRWHGFPEASGPVFVEPLAQLTTRMAVREPEPEYARFESDPPA